VRRRAGFLTDAWLVWQAEMREFRKHRFEMQRVIEERIARIEQRFTRIETILLEHQRIVEALPEAVVSGEW
jgi:hypothetical protein